MIARSVQQEIVRRIRQVSTPAKIFIFGSYAYGNPTPDSDIDIAVIMEDVESNVAKASELWDALSDMPMPKDIVVASRREFDFYRNEAGSLFRTIAQKGIVLSAG
jgi:predicted nucleotidyltransferase